MSVSSSHVSVLSSNFISQHKRAELGYWIGVPFWSKGYCTEAAKAVVEYGFKILGYHKITSRHIESNLASGKVMEKASMSKEGRLIDEVIKDGTFHTLIVYGIINSEPDSRGKG